jgi:hypothetical protein
MSAILMVYSYKILEKHQVELLALMIQMWRGRERAETENCNIGDFDWLRVNHSTFGGPFSSIGTDYHKIVRVQPTSDQSFRTEIRQMAGWCRERVSH